MKEYNHKKNCPLLDFGADAHVRDSKEVIYKEYIVSVVLSELLTNRELNKRSCMSNMLVVLLMLYHESQIINQDVMHGQGDNLYEQACVQYLKANGGDVFIRLPQENAQKQHDNLWLLRLI